MPVYLSAYPLAILHNHPGIHLRGGCATLNWEGQPSSIRAGPPETVATRGVKWARGSWPMPSPASEERRWQDTGCAMEGPGTDGGSRREGPGVLVVPDPASGGQQVSRVAGSNRVLPRRSGEGGGGEGLFWRIMLWKRLISVCATPLAASTNAEVAMRGSAACCGARVPGDSGRCRLMRRQSAHRGVWGEQREVCCEGKCARLLCLNT